MAVEPEDPEPQPTPVARVKAAVESAIPTKQRPVYAVAISAALAALAPAPFGSLAAALLVYVIGSERRR